MAEKTNLQREDFSKWYIQTIQKADLMDYSPVRGCMIFKPDGYEIWEHIQEEFNKHFDSVSPYEIQVMERNLMQEGITYEESWME